MRAPEVVTDPGDPRLAPYAGLTGGRRRDDWERRHGVFVVEGFLAVAALLSSSFPPVSVLTAPAQRDRMAAVVGDLVVDWYEADRAVLTAVAGYDVHRGVLGIGHRRAPSEAADLLAGVAPVVITEGVNDHENLGAIFRNAAAFGAGAVLADPTTADPLYRRSVRVSLGHVLSVPFARLPAWPDDLDVVRASGRTILALTPARSATELHRAPEGPHALLVGAEGPGLSAPALAAADHRVRIPLASGVDSLNVATALAVGLALLQRR